MPLISSTPYNVTQIQGFALSGDSPWPIYLRSDGLKFYIGNSGDNTVFQYSMSVADDITTSSYDSKQVSVSDAGAILGLFFSTDGTKMFVCGNTGTDRYYSYTLSVAWDVSTATYDSLSVNAAGNNPRALYFKSDGLRMIAVEVGILRSYTLSSAWDISTMSYDSKFFDARPQDNDALGLHVSSDGLTIITAGGTDSDAYHEYTLSSAWDLDTASFTQSTSYDRGIVPANSGFTINSSETDYYLISTAVAAPLGKGVYQFDL